MKVCLFSCFSKRKEFINRLSSKASLSYENQGWFSASLADNLISGFFSNSFNSKSLPSTDMF